MKARLREPGPGFNGIVIDNNLVLKRGRINASTDLPLKHTRNKVYKELVLQHLVLQLFDDSRKGSTRFVSTGIRSTKVWIHKIKFYKNRFYRK